MGKMLASLLSLQTIEQQVATVKRRLKSRQNAVTMQQRRIDQLRGDWSALHEKSLELRKQVDNLAVDLKEKEALVAKRRASLNTAKTNKEYAAILTQINTVKADNARTEEHGLRALQEVDQVNAEAGKVQERIEAEEKRLQEIEQRNAGEIARLNDMLDNLSQQRSQAADAVNPEVLSVFQRIAATYEGEAMAQIEIHGSKPPLTYVCGGCFMSLNAEHANALQTRDEIRNCDNCGRILHLELKTQQSPIG